MTDSQVIKAGPAPGNRSSRSSVNRRWLVVGLLAPAVLVLGLTFLAPLFLLFRMSLNQGGKVGQVVPDFSLSTYVNIVADPFYWRVTWNTVLLCVVVVVCTIVVSYPIALFLRNLKSGWRGALITLTIAPLLISQIVRTYGWMVILGSGGVLEGILSAFGRQPGSLGLANNFTGVVIALVEIEMPYAILGMLAGFGLLNDESKHAASSLGAGPLRVFLRVTLPLSLPGIFTGALLVLVHTISSFVTPILVGGGRVFVLATEIYSNATLTLNWPLAAGLSVCLIVLFGILVGFYLRATRPSGGG